MSKEIQSPDFERLCQELSALIEPSRKQVAVAANSALTILFWKVGKRIKDEILNNERAEYGKQVVATVSAQLEIRYGRNFTEKNVRRMMQFATGFSDFEIVAPLARQLTWSHFLTIIPLQSMEAKIVLCKKTGREPVGLILCAETNKEQVELLEMHKDGIMVAEFWTTLPPKKELERKLHQLVLEARARLGSGKLPPGDKND